MTLSVVLMIIGIFFILAVLATTHYKKKYIEYGVMKVSETEIGLHFSLELTNDPEILRTKKEIRLRVQKQ